MKAIYTPGPWNYRITPTEDGFYIESERDDFIGDVGGGQQTFGEIKDNAKLMAVAPELLEALMDIVDAQHNPERTLASMNIAIANAVPIIKKATQ